MPKRFNDVLAIVVIVAILVIWVRFPLPETVLGATIAAFALILNFYFRKQGPV